MWAEQSAVDFSGKTILELSPLEAGHTWMMDQKGSKKTIIAIEAN